MATLLKKGTKPVAEEKTPKKRGGPKGPRKVKAMYLVFKGENVEILNFTKDAFAILAAKGSDPNVQFVDVSSFLNKKAA